MKCEICNKCCNGYVGLGTHVVKNHGSVKEYYDKYLKKSNEGKCKCCGNEVKFYKLNVGYRTTCSQNCSRKLMSGDESNFKRKNTMLKKYGVENPSQISGIGDKISEKAKLRLSDPKEKERISKLTKKAMNRPEIKKRHLEHLKPMSDKNKKLHSDLMFKLHSNPQFKSKVYTEERNKKISKSKKEYWLKHPEEKVRVGNIWKSWKEKDESGWRKHLLNASKKGFEKIFSPTGDTSLEIKIYSMMNTENIHFIKKYELGGKIYDAYIPDKNILLEFDGEFWHKQNLEECKYSYQKDCYFNDIVKNQIAEKCGIKLIRIRENSIPKTIRELL